MPMSAQMGVQYLGATTEILHNSKRPSHHGWPTLCLRSFGRHVRGRPQWFEGLCRDGTDTLERRPTGSEGGSSLFFLEFPLSKSYVDALSGGRYVEAPKSPKCCPLPWCHPRSSPTRFGLDAGWEPDGIYQQKSREKPTYSRTFCSTTSISVLTPSLVTRHR
jgi:hypothetical protein